jgi:hypothetical protein
MFNKSRQAWGERHGKVKLTPTQVRRIREEYVYRSRIYGSEALGRKYNVYPTAILKIVSGQNWSDKGGNQLSDDYWGE